MRGLPTVAACLTVCTATASHAQSVTHYDVQLEPRLESRSIVGAVTLTVALEGESGAIVLNRGSLDIDSVQEEGTARAFAADSNRERVTLPPSRSRTRMLTIRYHGTPKSGLVFAPRPAHAHVERSALRSADSTRSPIPPPSGCSRTRQRAPNVAG